MPEYKLRTAGTVADQLTTCPELGQLIGSHTLDGAVRVLFQVSVTRKLN
jgi:hypothetical protein